MLIGCVRACACGQVKWSKMTCECWCMSITQSVLPQPSLPNRLPASPGTFKKRPEGVVWFGAEVPQPMALSRMKRTICAAMLKFVASFGRVHSSFGDNNLPGGVWA